MKRFNLLFGLCIVAFTVFLVYSCEKEPGNNQQTTLQTEVRTPNPPPIVKCRPHTSIFAPCDTTYRDTIIRFELAPTLYSTESKIFQLCPNAQIHVTYTMIECVVTGNTKMHFIYDLEWDIDGLIASCPALQAEIAAQTANGNLVSLLDLLDHEVSAQVEYTEAFLASKNPQNYDCTKEKYYSVKFVKNTCYEWLNLADPEKGGFVFVKRSCGTEVCCVRRNNYCRIGYYVDGSPNIILSQPTNYQQVEGECARECTHDCGKPKGPYTEAEL